jgi:hypothetical protein
MSTAAALWRRQVIHPQKYSLWLKLSEVHNSDDVNLASNNDLLEPLLFIIWGHGNDESGIVRI